MHVTARMAEAWGLFSAGMDYEEIAEKMGVRPMTAECYVSQYRMATGAHDEARKGLVVSFSKRCERCGLGEPHECVKLDATGRRPNPLIDMHAPGRYGW